MTQAITPTLFERLGGLVSIDVAVDQLYDRIQDDPELAPFFDRVDLRRQRGHQKAFLAMALGGPRSYGGRGIAEAHRHLGICDHHVDLAAEDESVSSWPVTSTRLSPCPPRDRRAIRRAIHARCPGAPDGPPFSAGPN